jgi:hypothetical protein
MDNPIDHDFILVLDLKQHTVLAHAKPILRREVGQPFDITEEIIRKPLKGIGNSRSILLLDAPQVLTCSRFQSHRVVHVRILQWIE